MKSKRIISSLIAALVLSTALVGCASKSSDTSSSSTDKTAEAKLDADQTANVLGYDYESLDVDVIDDVESGTTALALGEGLMREAVVDGKDINVKAGAEKIDVNTDHTVYTFHLRDTKWSDGKAVTAGDYVYGWQRLANPKISQSYLGFLNEIGVKGATEAGVVNPADLGVKAIDDKTFEVTLAAPSAYFESTLNFSGLFPVRKDIVEKLGDQYGVDYKNMVFNGVFTLTDYQKGSKLVFTKNDKYWDAKNVKIKTVNASIVDEQATYNKMFDAKELDVIGGIGDFLAPLQKKAEAGDIQYVKGSLPSVFYYIFNTGSKNLSNAKIRQAISLSYDRKTQIDAVWKRNYPAQGLIPSKILVGTTEFRKEVAEPLTTVKDDPKKLLAEGMTEAGLGSDPSKLTLNLLMSKATSVSSAQAQFIQNQLKTNLGINVKITYSVDSPSYFKARTAGQFDLCAGGWGADYNDVVSFFNVFTSTNGNNNGKYKSADYDALVAKGKTELDAKKRVDLFKQAELLLVAKDAAVSPYFYQDIQSFRQNYLKGMYVPMFGAYYDLKNIYISGK